MLLEFGFSRTLLDGLIYLLLIYGTIALFVNSVFTTSNLKAKNQAFFRLIVFVTCWDVLYIHSFWNSFSVHSILTSLATLILVAAYTEKDGIIRLHRIGIFSVLAVSSILLANRLPMLNENVIASDNYRVFIATQKWYRWALWILVLISVIHYWGVQFLNWYRPKYEIRRIKKTFRIAEKCISRKNYRLAMDNYRSIIKKLDKTSIGIREKNRFEGEAYLGLGHALWEEKQEYEALKHYEQAMRCSKVDDQSLNRLARSWLDDKRYQAAYALLVRHPPQHKDTQILLSRCCLKLNKPGTAVEHLEKLCRKNAEYWKAHYYLGCAYGHQKNHTAAINSFISAAKLAPNQPSIYLQRGQAFFKASQFENARQDYLKCRDLGNRSEELNFALAAVMIEMGQYGEAAPLLVAIEYGSKYQEVSVLLLGLLYEQQQSFTEAIGIYESAVRNENGSGKLNARLGLVYLKIQNFEMAEQSLVRAIQAGIDNDNVLYNLGWVYYQQSKLEKCILYWKKLNQRLPENRKLKNQLKQVYYLQACIHARNKDFDNAVIAVSEYQKQSNSSGNASVAGTLAEIFFQAASFKIHSDDKYRISIAREYMNRARDLNSKDFRFPYHLALIEAEGGNLSDSATLLRSIKAVTKNARLVLYQLALCQVALEEKIPASKVFESLSSERKRDTVARKALLSLAAIKMQEANWSEAADLLLAHNHRET